MKPYISIVIATYNRPDLLKKAVHSAVNFSKDKALEVIVVDDCSSTTIPDTVKGLATVIRLEKNSGPGPARMKGIQASNSPYALILDDDDELKPDHLDVALSAISTLNENWISCQFSTDPKQLDRATIFDIHDYWNGNVKGDFTPIINSKNFLGEFEYPNTKIGAEHLLWWKIAQKPTGIPSFPTTIVEVGNSATSRLTDTESQIRKSEEHLAINLLALKEHAKEMQEKSPKTLLKTQLAVITYALLSGRRKTASKMLFQKPTSAIKLALIPLFLLPQKAIIKTFTIYRRNQLLKEKNK